MKALLLVLFFCFYSSLSFSQTQREMNDDAMTTYKKTDKKLNEVYQEIMTKYKAKTNFIKCLKNAQGLWVQFRDAQLAMKYPEQEPGHYGSVLPMCQESYLTELTETRIKELQAWLAEHKEGDVCNGSVGDIQQ
jgi:uncharacterized protein YecT (DUF1311 family)